MQQLVIKLSPAATQQYLKIATAKNTGETQAEMNNNIEASSIHLDINLAMMAGLTFADIGVDGQSITSESDDEDLEIELIEINWTKHPLTLHRPHTFHKNTQLYQSK